jgi:hypothetical protein
MDDSLWLITVKPFLMAFRFEELIIWEKAFALANEIDLITQSFPKRENVWPCFTNKTRC